MLKEYFYANKERLCPTCNTRLEANPLRILDCKSPICGEIAAKAPQTIDHLCADCLAHFESLKAYLDKATLLYTVNPRIVRGLDYYRRTVFEFICDDIGAQSTVCGGGRYDGLVEALGGPKLGGIGFAMGLTRIIMALQARGKLKLGRSSPRLYIAALGEAARIEAFILAQKLRLQGVNALCDLMGRSLKAQMKYADKIGAQNTLIIGDDEVSSRRCELKNMHTSEQKTVDLDKFSL